MRTTVILNVGLIFNLLSCSSNTNDERIEAAFQDLATRHSLLKIPSDSSYSDCFTLFTSVENHPQKIKYNIFKRLYNQEEIVVLTVDYRNKISAVPILPFSQSCYWKYENEVDKCGSKKCNFQYEYNRMLKELSLNDSLHLAYSPYGIIINNILHVETVRFHDTLSFQQQCSYYDKDSAFIVNRNKKNTLQLIELMHPEYYSYKFLGKKDNDAKHVIWGEVKRNSHKKVELFFKAFNFECAELPMIYL